VPLILDENVQRRHLSKGQRAMAVATIYPDKQKRGPKAKAGNSSKIEELEGVGAGYLSMARLVRRYTPEAAEVVLLGERALALALTIP
jgi:hypothetical protein